MKTFTTAVCSFTSERGNHVEVFRVRAVGEVGEECAFAVCGQTVRTFARVCEQEVEVEAGCAFKAHSAVREAGF